jgi:hypothetical protein
LHIATVSAVPISSTAYTTAVAVYTTLAAVTSSAAYITIITHTIHLI